MLRFRFALRGVAHTFQTENNFRIMCAFFAAVVAAGLFFGLTATEWAAVLVCCGATMAAELLNTAVEAVVDLVSPTYHARAAKAKDAASGASFTIALFSAAVGLIVFIPYIAALFGQSARG